MLLDDQHPDREDCNGYASSGDDDPKEQPGERANKAIEAQKSIDHDGISEWDFIMIGARADVESGSQVCILAIENLIGLLKLPDMLLVLCACPFQHGHQINQFCGISLQVQIEHAQCQAIQT